MIAKKKLKAKKASPGKNIRHGRAVLPPVPYVLRDVDFGKIAYEAYSSARRGKNMEGIGLPVWANVRPDIRLAWMKAARAVRLVL